MDTAPDSDAARLDAADWRAPIGPFASLGQAFTVQTDDAGFEAVVTAALADLLAAGSRSIATVPAGTDQAGASGPSSSGPSWARFRVLTPGTDARGVIMRDDERVGRGTSSARLLGSLVWGVNRWVLDHASHARVLLHAGGLVDDTGRAVLLPAASESGKSTLTAALALDGLAYLSDEAVEVLPDGSCTGYAKPISIDPGAFALFDGLRPLIAGGDEEFLNRQWHVPAGRVTRVAREARLAAVVFPAYDPATSTSLQPLSPSEALVLAANCTFAPGNGVRVERWQVERLAAALRGVPCYRLPNNDLDEAVASVRTALAG